MAVVRKSKKGKPERLINRAQLAELLGISVSEVIRKERCGYFEPDFRGKQGKALYSPGLVEQVRELQANTKKGRPSGLSVGKQKENSPNPLFTPEECVRVFEELERGTSLVDCVKRLKILPEAVKAIAKDYLSMAGGMILPGNVVEELNALPMEGSFPLTPNSLLDAVKRALESDSPCSSCGKGARAYCRRCAEA